VDGEYLTGRGSENENNSLIYSEKESEEYVGGQHLNYFDNLHIDEDGE
jgi:hypothetical protein